MDPLSLGESSNEMASSRIASNLLQIGGMSQNDANDIAVIIQATDYVVFPIGTARYRSEIEGAETLNYLRDLIRDLDLISFADIWGSVIENSDHLFQESGLSRHDFDVKQLAFLKSIQFPIYMTSELQFLNPMAEINIKKLTALLEATINNKES